jgi:signal transduction histidine kinase
VKRSLLVIALLLVAAGVPGALWFVSGSREAEREAARVVQQAREDAMATARTAAGQLGTRLEKLRITESQRPYFHYQNLMHDPRGASQGLSVVPSPLAQGPADPLILTHFQIDGQGRVTMPTLNDDVRELNAPDVNRQVAMRKTLLAAEPELIRESAPSVASLVSEVETRRNAANAAEQASRRQTTHTEVAATVAAPTEPAMHRAETTAGAAPPPQPQPAATPQQQMAEVPLRRTTAAPPPRVTRTDMLNNSSLAVAPGSQQNVFSNSQQSLSANAQQSTPANSQNTLLNAHESAPVQQQASPREPPPLPKEIAQVQQKSEPARVQKLDPSAFAQNAQSNAVYSELKTPPGVTAAKNAPKKTTLPPRHAPEVEIATHDFAWSSVRFGGQESLAALRPVVTPAGAFVQGFLISGYAAGELLPTGGSLRLHAGVGAFPVGGTGWSLDVDDRAAVATAMARADNVRRAFQRTFYGGITAAALAIIAVAVLVWRSERLARERAQFAAAAAHELRTPLAGLRLYGDMLAHQLGDPERSRLYAQHVSEEAERLGRVVANMLEFTRLERGSLTVKREPGNLAEAVRECVEQLRPALELAGCQVVVSIAGELPPVAFDRDAVHHIVQNLLDNAEKYSRPSPDRRLEIDLTRMNGHALLTVSDRGVGVDARTARHLFLPFERGSAGDAPAGLGLGLVLVKALAEAHGGDVSWQARSGGGTTFSVRLPAFYTP